MKDLLSKLNEVLSMKTAREIIEDAFPIVVDGTAWKAYMKNNQILFYCEVLQLGPKEMEPKRVKTYVTKFTDKTELARVLIDLSKLGFNNNQKQVANQILKGQGYNTVENGKDLIIKTPALKL
jgi:hypothetical protein